MKKYLVFLFFASCFRCWGADGIDVFKTGLEAYRTNRAETLLAAWYQPNDKAIIGQVRKKFADTTDDLGEVVDTEVFEPKSLGRHIQHFYGVIYFRKSPLWVRAVYYSLGDQRGYLSIEFSKRSDEILPGVAP
jgi:hypothetical protein